MESTPALSDDYDDARDRLRARIEAVPPEFAEKVRQKYPTLTNMEIEICRLGRAGLTIDEITVWHNRSKGAIAYYYNSICFKLDMKSVQALHKALEELE